MDKKKFYCQSCDYGCDNNSTYNKHLKSQVHARGGQKKIYKCEYCDYSTKISVWNCKMHTLAKHASKEVKAQQKYYCDSCDVLCFSPLFFNNHNKNISHLTNVAKKQILEPPNPEKQPEIIPQELIDNKITEITNNQLKIDSAKLEIYMMIDNLANKIKDKTKKEFKVEVIKKIITSMLTLLD
uniref:C2H2-type domain-containing protein n=1 Tax=viral metagenome TaxID=1070528 RepID=A0A6C0E2Q5_9ZZZZ